MRATFRSLMWCLLAGSALLGGCSSNDDGDGTENPVTYPRAGGDTSVSDRTSAAYEQPAPNLTEEELSRHTEGDKAFGRKFVTADGLGPLFDNTSCSGCHINDGRGRPVAGTGFTGSQIVVRVSLPDNQGSPEVPYGNVPVPGIGTQIQDHAILGELPEASIELNWEEVPGTYPDGTAFSLRKPVVGLQAIRIPLLPPDMEVSVRTAPPVFGRGLLEAIPDADIVANADVNDDDGDGISGKPNYVWSASLQSHMLGRFGWKANNPSVREQVAAAYFNDMGVTTSVFPEGGAVYEVPDEELDFAAFYVQTLAVPIRRDMDSLAIQRGEDLFGQVHCNACHIPEARTGTHPEASLSSQTIYPYTDMLVHDLGPGLADNRWDFDASGQEWRTTPLWGVGLTETVLGGPGTFLHDGRARSLEEAILWHGGEAQASRDAFASLIREQRELLLEFLYSL